MKLSSILACATVLLAAILAPSLRSAPVAAARWKVDRMADGLGPLPLVSDIQQQIAQQVGAGQFVVADWRAEFPAVKRPVQVLAIFASEAARARGEKPLGRALVLESALTWFAPGDDNGLVSAALRAFDVASWSDDPLRAALPEIAARLLYGGDAVVSAGSKAFARDEHGWTWQAEAALGTRRERIVLTWHQSAAPTAEVTRTTLPVGVAIAPPAASNAAKLEQWLIDDAPAWRPTKRYQVRLALAALRHDPVRDYQLAVDLLADPDPGAKAAGLRLLKQTAATGYPDSCNLLARIEHTPRHSSDDRELVRSER